MRQYSRSTSKPTSANRIRERYLHQLGLQRGGGVVAQRALSNPQVSQHVVVISGLPGLPSLPEERPATSETNAVMEGSDFSSNPTASTNTAMHPPSPLMGGYLNHQGSSGSIGDYSGDNEGQGSNDGGESDSGSSHAKSANSLQHHSPLLVPSMPGHTPPDMNDIGGTGRPITSMALSYPKALLQVPPQLSQQPQTPNLTSPELHATSFAPGTPSANGLNGCQFSLPQAPWCPTSLSKPTGVFLNSSDHLHGNDHDSLSSTATSTTAESSFSAMVSRDWGAVAQSSCGASVASQGGDSLGGGGTSPAGAQPGVHFQRSGPGPHTRLMGNSGQGHCGATTSLTHALNRFNIDSDCEASIASNSVAGCGNSIMTEEDYNMDEDEISCDDTASRASLASQVSCSDREVKPNSVLSSSVSVGSNKSQLSSRRGARKKIGKAQRLMDRAAAHERILQIRNDRSQKLRANLVQSQRNCVPSPQSSGLSMVLPPEDMQLPPPAGSSSSNDPASGSPDSKSSVPLLHVQHGILSAKNVNAPDSSLHGNSSVSNGVFHGNDLGRTPTASNCSMFGRKKQGGAETTPPSFLSSVFYPSLNTLPVGVHIASNTRKELPQPIQDLKGSGPINGNNSCESESITIKPLGRCPQLASRIPTPPPKVLHQSMNTENVVSNPSLAPSHTQMEARETEDTTMESDAKASIDDVLEVALTLSNLGGRGSGTVIPRLR